LVDDSKKKAAAADESEEKAKLNCQQVSVDSE